MFKERDYKVAVSAKGFVGRLIDGGFEPWEIMFEARWGAGRYLQNSIRWRGMVAAVLKAGCYDPYTGQWWMPSTKDVLRWYRQAKRAESKNKKIVVTMLDSSDGTYWNEAV